VTQLLYTALRGGLFTGDFTSQEVNPYGIAAVAGITFETGDVRRGRHHDQVSGSGFVNGATATAGN
jgi:hypothetical protein